eukprot:SAG22_NODE_3794_length_1528_cov_1.433870_2_plen_114_part_00
MSAARCVVRDRTDDGKSWWLLEPSIVRAGPFMYSGIVPRASNRSHVTLGFVFESFVNQTRACDPWCLDPPPPPPPPPPQELGLGAGAGEPNTGLSITYAERTFSLPPKPPQQQ